MTRNILHILEEGMDTFSKGQRRIARFILDHCGEAAAMTASRLGKLAGVSESTVVRFASELGYDGYPAMQKALQELVRSRLTSLQRIEASTDRFSGSDLITTVLHADMEKIRQAVEEVSREDFRIAVEELMTARHIYILGVRSSSFLAGYLHFYFHLIFDNVILVTENSAGDILEKILRIGPEDVLIGITFPRYSSSTAVGVRFARDRGARIIAVTDGPSSPLYSMAAANLTARSDMISFVDSLVAPFSLLNALIVAAGYRKNADISQIFGSLEHIWEEYGVFGGSNEE